jgi:beta-lactam-binding protein with PASTA domain
MNKAILLGAGLAVSSVATILFGSVAAQAASDPNVVGQKYSDASGTLSSAGLSVVVSTTVGDSVARPDCIVTRQQGRTEAPPENTSASPTNQVLLSLNCGAPVASAKSSGNSLASPEGRAAAAAAASATPSPSE